MHERERHRIILSAVQEKSVVTIQDISELTEASEATIRRDIAALHVQGKIRRVRGGGGSRASAAARQSRRSPVPRFRIRQHRQKALNRPRSRRSLRSGRCDHHQRRHHHLPDGAFHGRRTGCR